MKATNMELEACLGDMSIDCAAVWALRDKVSILLSRLHTRSFCSDSMS